MKKTLGSIVLASAIMSGVVGCGGATPQAKEEGDFRCRQDNVLAPEWTCNPYMEGSMVAVGIAKVNAGNDKAFQREEAMADGRKALSKQISVKVDTLFKSFKSTTGADANGSFDAASSSVSKQLASSQINGSRAIKSWTQPKQKSYLF